MHILCTRELDVVSECDAVLLSAGIAPTWQRIDTQHLAAVLEVDDAYTEQACAALTAVFGENAGPRVAPDTPLSPLWHPAFAMSLSLACLLLVFFFITGDVETDGPWQARGALARAAVLHGQWWRVVTAAFLHADLPHALSNAAFLLVLGWAAGERLGAGVALSIWLNTAVAGFALSLACTQVSHSVGASGGIFGLLGAAAGHAGRHALGRRRREVGGAAIMLLCFTAFSEHANRAAHVGGFVAGVLLGALAPGAGVRGQLLASATVAALVLAAWTLAWHPNGLFLEASLR